MILNTKEHKEENKVIHPISYTINILHMTFQTYLCVDMRGG